MLNDLAILKNVSAMASHAARKHGVIAKNIANADTPGFKAQEVEKFSDLYAKAVREQKDISELVSVSKLLDSGGAESASGNTVSLEEQMLTSAEAVGEHEMALAIYRKTLDMMKMAIGKNI